MSWRVSAENLGSRHFSASRTVATESEAIEVAIEWLREQFSQRPDIVERLATPTRKDYEIVTGRFRFAGTIVIEETQVVPATESEATPENPADGQDAPMPKAVAWLGVAVALFYIATFVRCCIEIYS